MFYLLGAHTPAQAALFQTGWFVESLLSQTLIIHVIRTARTPFVERRPSLPLAVTSVSICLVGLWLPHSPLRGLLGFAPLPAAYWPLLGFVLTAYLALTYVVKRWLHRRFGLT